MSADSGEGYAKGAEEFGGADSRYVCRHESSGMADFPPARMLVCDCGANAECPVCGYSFGAWPCGCDGIVAERKPGWVPNA
jgi:hypothetical protein